MENHHIDQNRIIDVRSHIRKIKEKRDRKKELIQLLRDSGFTEIARRLENNQK
jgi:acetolactate synthase small subunit